MSARLVAAMNRSSRRAAQAKGEWIPLRRVELVPPTPTQIAERIAAGRELLPHLTVAEVTEQVMSAFDPEAEVWKNDRYQVHVLRWPNLAINGKTVPVVQLSIRRLDRAPTRDWRDFQCIKTELLGAEVEAIELYPAESRVVDTANQFHLWAVVDPLFRFPFGYNAGRVVSSKSSAGAVQRPLPGSQAS